jgi:DNA-directed RNA polymerase subunit M/transcription elongation factor TFIIS
MAMRFCPDCANLLAPREKPANRIEEKEKKLQYYCKICNYVDDNITESCVYVNELVKNQSTKLDVILSDVNKDPTLQRSHDVCCSECQHNVAVFFQAEQQAKSTALYLIYVCCKCGHKWMDE